MSILRYASLPGCFLDRHPDELGSSTGLSPASGFEHPASTLPTRFPAALGIGHGLPAASLMHAH